MIKFLFKISVFTIVLWLCGFAYQSIIDKGLQKHYSDDYSEWIEIYTQRVNHDVVILGSSRAWVQVNPKVIEEQSGLSCFNLGIDGGRLQMQKTMWKSLLAQGNRPKLIIQVVDYFALNTRTDLYWKERFMPYLNYIEVYEPLTEIDSSLWMSRYLPPLRYHGYDDLNSIGWKNYFNIPLEPSEEPVHTKYNGYKGTQHSIEVEPTWLNAKKLETQVEVEKIEFGRGALNEMITAFKKENIPVILVYLPTYHLLRKSVKNRDLVVKMFQEVANESGAEYWDMSMDSVSNDMTLYADPLHMNYKGADVITAKLCLKINHYLK
jgi:hypothetical protein